MDQRSTDQNSAGQNTTFLCIWCC